MVRALLDGSKTQTRRVVKPQPDTRAGMNCTRLIFKDRKGAPLLDEALEATEPVLYRSLCPYGQPGDQLLVRETFYAWGRWETRFSAKKGRDEWHFVDMTLECGKAYLHDADHPRPQPLAGKRDGGVTPKWVKRPAIFMPRAACRITLEIVSVRVERLQDISEADARAEGITDAGCTNCGNPEPCGCAEPAPDARDAYCYLWKSINGDSSWHANPWVWVVEFKRVPVTVFAINVKGAV